MAIIKEKAAVLGLFIGEWGDQLEPLNNEVFFKEKKWDTKNFSNNIYSDMIGKMGYLSVAPGIAQAISRVYRCKKEYENFGGFATLKDSGFVSEYFAGDNKEVPSPGTKKIVVLEKDGVVYANKYTLGVNGIAEPLKVRWKVKDSGENGSFWMFHRLAKAVLKPEHKYEKQICVKYLKIEATLDQISNLDENEMLTLARDLVDLENDLYGYCILEADIPGTFPQFKEEMIQPDQIVGAPSIIKSTTTAPKKKAKAVVEKLSKMVKNGAFAIGSSTNTTDRYDDTTPSDQVVQVCKLMKVNHLGLLPKKMAQNFFFSGPAGTGKSTAAYQIARLLNVDYYSITGSEDMTYNDIVLNILPDADIPGKFKYVESPFVKAFRDGGVIEFQEVNCVRKPSVLTALNCALDDSEALTLPTGEIVKRHPDTVVIFTANVDYNGTRPMNQALLSRCLNKFEFELPSDSELVQRLAKETAIDKEVANKMVKVMHSIQKVMFDNGIDDGVCGYRELLAWAKDTVVLGTPYQCAINTVVNGASLDPEARELVIQGVQTQFTKDDVCASLWDTL